MLPKQRHTERNTLRKRNLLQDFVITVQLFSTPAPKNMKVLLSAALLEVLCFWVFFFLPEDKFLPDFEP